MVWPFSARRPGLRLMPGSDVNGGRSDEVEMGAWGLSAEQGVLGVLTVRASSVVGFSGSSSMVCGVRIRLVRGWRLGRPMLAGHGWGGGDRERRRGWTIPPFVVSPG